MPLRVLDGNQTATTLSSVVTGGEHIVAHSVVCFGSTAIANITNAISGSVVSISNFPSTQTIAGTVTANVDALLGDTTFTDSANVKTLRVLPHYFDVNTNENLTVDNDTHPLPISGTVTANVPNLVFESNSPGFYGVPIMGLNNSDTYQTITLDEDGRVYVNAAGTVTVGNSVTIGSLPAISGTVTARLQDGLGNNLTSTSIGGLQRLNVSLASAATPGGSIPTFVNVYGGSDSGTVRAVAVDSSGRSVVTVSNFPATQAVSLASTTVTVSALPSGALTTRFGSVTTASVAQITSAVTNTSRKYLLAQNISAGTVTIGIGFSPTTTQGIQLTAGGGLTFDAFCPNGAVYWLGAVTGAAFTILEG